MRSVAMHLAWRQWRARPLRPVLCSLAIAAAVTLVVCCGAGFDSMKASLTKGIGQLLGRADIYLRPAFKAPNARLATGMVDELRRDPAVARVSGRMESQISLKPVDKPDALANWVFVVGMEPSEDDFFRPKNLLSGHLLSAAKDAVAATNPAAGEIVIDSTVAKKLDAHPGDRLTVTDGEHGETTVTVAGIISSPGVEILQKPTAYFPIADIARDLAVEPEWNVIDVQVKSGADGDAFEKSLKRKYGQAVAITSAQEGKHKLQSDAQGANIALAMLSIISAICASLIIATTLSVGVQERVRQFGHLRCIGASRGQLLVMLLADALLLMMAGTGIGLVTGQILARLLVWHFSNIFLTFEFSLFSLLIAIGNGVIATLIGSLIPAWQVVRITPMQAVQSMGRVTKPRLIWLSGALGVMAIGLQAILWQVPSRDLRIMLYAVLGIPCVFLGYAMLGPTVLLVLERFGHRPLAWLMAVRAPLLRNAWSRTPWRSGGMIAALMIGITMLVSVQERGAGLMNSWNFPHQFPDLLLFKVPIFASPGDPVPFIKKQDQDVAEATAIGIFYARLKNPTFKIGPAQKQESTLFVAVNPETFRSMVKMEFLQGDEATAFAKMAAPNSHTLLIAREYQVARGIGVGDKIPLMTATGEVVEFEVGGVVASAGVDLAKNYFDLRSSFQEQAVSSVLGTQKQAEQFFSVRTFNVVLANVKPGADAVAARGKLEHLGWQTASAVEMKHKIGDVIERFVHALTIIGIGAMCVASLGVANMVIASIQARRFEFGILRAIGAGRWQLIRLVLAESSMISIVAAILGSAAGLHFTFMATQVDKTVVGFPTAFVLAPGAIGLAFAATIVLGVLASFWPAWRGANQAQQTVLAAGRA